MAVYQHARELIGDTPLVRLRRFEAAYSCRAELYGKCEFLNPAGTVKDRAALGMITAALRDGRLEKGGTVVCLTGGSGGVSAAEVCAMLGLRCVLAAQDTMTMQDIRRARALGAQVVVSPSSGGVKGLRERAQALLQQHPGGFLMDQFEDAGNPLAHRGTTGPELLRDLPQIAALVAGIGTGGTITGCGEALKMHLPDCQIIGVEPADSPVISGGMPTRHDITGIGPGFVPETLNRYILDKVIRVRTSDAYEAAHQLALTEGLLCGPSSGAALAAAVFLGQQVGMFGRQIAVILPDRGDNYLDRGGYFA